MSAVDLTCVGFSRSLLAPLPTEQMEWIPLPLVPEESDASYDRFIALCMAAIEARDAK